MIVRFTRLNPTHHRFEAIRDDGVRETRDLETRSMLTHDLVHFALESEGRLSEGFYGALARGASYETEAAADVEHVVGPLQSGLKGAFDSVAFVERLRVYRESIGERAPDWLTADLIMRAADRFHRLEGQWRATPFGQAMELTFDV